MSAWAVTMGAGATMGSCMRPLPFHAGGGKGPESITWTPAMAKYNSRVLNLSAASRRVYAAGFVDALLLTPILKNSLAGMGVPIRCFEGMNDEQIAAIISKEI